MLAWMGWILATVVSLTTAPTLEVPKNIKVDCESTGALERALSEAAKLGEVDIFLDGVCTGNFVIASDGVTLRGATPGSGLAAPIGNPSRLPVIEIVDAQASLRGLIVQGAEAGVLVRGWDADVLLFGVDVHNRDGIGVLSSQGAEVRLIDTTIHDGLVGISAELDSRVNLQRVIVSNQQIGVAVSGRSFMALNDTTIENNSEGGLTVGQRSEATVLGGAYRENGEIHIHASDRSDITLLFDPTIGSATDPTRLALGVTEYASITSYGTSALYGDVYALIGGSIRLGNTVLDGDLTVIQFANAHVRNATITGTVACVDGADAICRQTTTAGAFGCPSSTCGPATAEATGRWRQEQAAPNRSNDLPNVTPSLPALTSRH